MKLGQLLLQERLVTAPQLEEALEAQVLYGGRLGTNLVELGYLKEPDLARVLGRQHNLPFSSGEMVPDPAAVAVLGRQFYDDHDVLPMRLEPTRITVAVLDANQVEALEAVGFKAGKRVVAVVIPEFRMNQLLRAHAKAFRPLRPIDMNTLRQSKEAAASVKAPDPSDVGDLINESDFAAIYAKAAGSDDEVIEGAVVVEEAPAAPVSPAPTTQPVAASAPAPAATLPRPITAPAPARAPAAPVEPPPPPLSFAEAQKELAASSNREDIARTVLRFAISKFRRALLLNVQGVLVTGWHGMGRGVTDKTVRRIGVSLKEANTFQLVSQLKSHFVGPLKRTPGMTTFYEILGGAFPRTAVVLPLLVRSKLVHLLYLDNGPDQLTPPDVGELLIVSQSVTRSYEAIIRGRKAERATEARR